MAFNRAQPLRANYFGTFRFRFKQVQQLADIQLRSRQEFSGVPDQFRLPPTGTIHEYTGAYVRNFHEKGKFQPFFLVGAGMLRFNPQQYMGCISRSTNNIPIVCRSMSMLSRRMRPHSYTAAE